MKRILCILFAIHTFYSDGQTVRDLKQKTPENQTERTEILNLARNEVYSEFSQEVVFVVRHFKVCGNYAWFEGDVQRKDGGAMQFPDEAYDCCHAEGLFVKKNGHWTIVEFGSFSTDCWYCGISERYPTIPKGIFKEGVHY